MPLQAIEKRSLPDKVFEQLTGEIVAPVQIIEPQITGPQRRYVLLGRRKWDVGRSLMYPLRRLLHVATPYAA